MAEHMEEMFLRGESASVARHAQDAVGFVLDAVMREGRTYPLAKKSLKGFVRKAPEPSRDPRPETSSRLAWSTGGVVHASGL
jgi:hypothetical protein